MALDYYLEIDKYGEQEKIENVRELIRSYIQDFELENINLSTDDVLKIGYFIDDEVDRGDTGVHALVISFRLDKFQHREAGYSLLRQISRKILDAVDVDLWLTDESGEDTYLKRESGNISTMNHDHDIWKTSE